MLAAVSVLVVATVGLLLIALIAAASFVVIAHRRMRQLGMLAAIGATEKQLRLVTLTNGTLVGAVAAVIGAVVGFAGWVVAAPFVEDAVGYRVDQFDMPWWLIASGMLLAVVAGTVAAWWPARTVARVPAVRALSGPAARAETGAPRGRPGRSVHSRRSSAVSRVGGRRGGRDRRQLDRTPC